MHVAIAWDNKPLLLLATALLPNRITESLQMEAGPPYDKQRIQMGLPSDNTVLYFRSGVDHYQSVLIALAADLHTSISFGSVSRRFALTLLGCLNSWLALTAVLPWTGAGSEVPPSEAPFKGAWRVWGRGGGGRRSEGRRGLHLRKASRGLQRGFKGGLKGASRGLEGGLKGASLRKASKGLKGGFKGALRGLEGGLKGRLQGWLEGSLKGAWPSRGLKGGFKGSTLKGAKRGLEGGLKPSSLEGSFTDASRRLQMLLVVVGCCWL